MVETGHHVDRREFANPDRPGLGIEVLTHAELRSRLSDTYYSALHRLEFHQILLVHGGSAIVRVDFIDYECVPGTLVHTRPGQVQLLPMKADGSPSDLYATLILFKTSFPPPLPASADYSDPYATRWWALDSVERANFEHDVAAIDDEYRRSGSASSPEILRHLLAVLLLRLEQLTSADSMPPDPARAALHRAFRRELEESFAGERTTQTYAQRLGCSQRTLNRACLEATGHTAKHLVDARTALEAQRLLVNTQLSVAAIARRLGFSEASNFGKFFVRETGCTPGAFRSSGG